MYLSEKDFAKLIERCPHLVKDSEIIPEKIPKYKNVKVYEYADGFISIGKKAPKHGKVKFCFDSTKEYYRWNELKILERSGVISNLERQKRILIQDSFVYASATGISKTINSIFYIADFSYTNNGKVFIEDVKPLDENSGKYRLTKDFQLKWKLMMFKYPDYEFVIF